MPYKNNIAYISLFAILLLNFKINISTATNQVKTTSLENAANTNYQQSLKDYLTLPETASTNFQLIAKSADNLSKTTKIEYSFISQTWPKTGPENERTSWHHKIDVYIPSQLKYDTALLWVNGGTLNVNISQTYNPKPLPLNFNEIAQKTHSVVIDLQNIPNQYITLDNKKFAEDGLIAYTWAKFLKDPAHNRYTSAYLPMVKAVIKSIDNIQALNFSKLDLLAENINNDFKINNFIVSGLSKRGLTTWLASLHDNRIKAIIPMSIDLLNTKANMTHIFKSHQGWPIAMRDYSEQNVLQNLSSPSSEYLMQINDPYQYIQCSNCDHKTRHAYEKRASIDKYLIMASGDDFFVPDSTLFYYDQLPGYNNLRFIPNSPHSINNEIISNTLLTYTYLINNHKQNKAQILKSDLTKNIFSLNKYNLKITTKTLPHTITLYTAHNSKKRDFRLAEGIKYQQTNIPVDSFDVSIAEKKKSYQYSIEVIKPKEGWEAYFVELEFTLADQLPHQQIPNLKLTTPVYILPRNYPEMIKASIKDNADAIIHYGNTVIYPIKQKLKNKQP